LEAAKKKVAKKPDSIDYEEKKKTLETLKSKSLSGDIYLYFQDESGFSLTPSVSYAWQYTGENIEIPSSRSQQINVMGFLGMVQDWKSLTFNGSIDSGCIITAIDQLFPSVDRETWIVMDNAPTHKSKKFTEKILEWAKKKINIFFLPAYSPELNPIEIVWRFIKYYWLPLSAYQSFQKLTESLNEILANFGRKYLIIFA
jgi:hypothetical protein